jgi:hypothetical protein
LYKGNKKDGIKTDPTRGKEMESIGISWKEVDGSYEMIRILNISKIMSFKEVHYHLRFSALSKKSLSANNMSLPNPNPNRSILFDQPS